MRVALDTNIVLRNAHRADPRNKLVASYLQDMVKEGAELCIPHQVVHEFWVVATRPVDVNGLGLAPAEVRGLVDGILRAYTLLSDPPDVLLRWLDLCTRHCARGRAAHDARLVAWMLGHGIKRLMTFNTGDFQRYAEVECMSPV